MNPEATKIPKEAQDLIQIEDEFVIKANGTIVKRQVISAPVINGPEALAEALMESSKTEFHPIPVYLGLNPIKRSWYKLTVSSVIYIHEMNYWPMTDQALTELTLQIKTELKDNGALNIEELYMSDPALGMQNKEEIENYYRKKVLNEKPITVQWSPPKEYELFIVQVVSFGSTDLMKPYIFCQDKANGSLVVPFLPNVFEDGGICVGDAYRNFPSQKRKMQYAHETAYDLINRVFNAVSNDHIRDTGLERGWCVYDKDGKSVHPKEIQGIRNPKFFYYKSNQASAIEFFEWKSKNKKLFE